MKTLNITIDSKGKVSIETGGFSGSECLAATKPIEDALGAVDDRKQKPEMLAGGTGLSQQVTGQE